MRRYYKYIPGFLIGSTGMAVLIWALGIVPAHGQICEYAQSSQENCATYNIVLVALFKLGKVLESASGTFTALATIALAIITWRLVTLGRDQSKTTRAQLRAYLSVIIGQAVYQDRARELRFEAKPAILNNGDTPAYNVRVRIKAEILTNEEARVFVFAEPPDVPTSQSSIGPKEHRLISGLIDRYVSDDEIQDICNGNGKGLYVWGVVHYEDVFRCPHFTQFAQKLWWFRDRSNIQGAYDGRFGLSD